MKMQTGLPKEFVQLMREHYDAATADALCSALETTEPDVSVRLNPRKLSAEEVLACNPGLEAVSWCPNAFYLPDRPAFTFDPLLHAGAYYVQEAASMYIAQVMTEHETGEPLLAIDLCAAPGGKSTLLQSLLPEDSLLISNEPIAKRAQVLSENMQKWMTGQPAQAPRSIVTQNYSAEFGTLTGLADILLTDVPCSGEGMFRKDEGARQEWSLANVAHCQQRQRDILSDAWHVLKPGGLLIYSTCTFNRYEDEDNARWICSELGGQLFAERHFLPGLDRGEGFYVAGIVKGHGARGMEQGAWSMGQGAWSKGHGARGKEQGVWSMEHGVRGLNVLYDSRQPAFPEGTRIELSYGEALQYLRREALRLEAPRGPVTLCYRGLVLGPGKGVGSRINNLYPDAWRIRTTYTTPFSLLSMP